MFHTRAERLGNYSFLLYILAINVMEGKRHDIEHHDP
jgi:hypothetical protein